MQGTLPGAHTTYTIPYASQKSYVLHLSIFKEYHELYGVYLHTGSYWLPPVGRGKTSISKGRKTYFSLLSLRFRSHSLVLYIFFFSKPSSSFSSISVFLQLSDAFFVRLFSVAPPHAFQYTIILTVFFSEWVREPPTLISYTPHGHKPVRSLQRSVFTNFISFLWGIKSSRSRWSPRTKKRDNEILEWPCYGCSEKYSAIGGQERN